MRPAGDSLCLRLAYQISDRKHADTGETRREARPMQYRDGYGEQHRIGIAERREWPNVRMHDAVEEYVRKRACRRADRDRPDSQVLPQKWIGKGTRLESTGVRR